MKLLLNLSTYGQGKEDKNEKASSSKGKIKYLKCPLRMRRGWRRRRRRILRRRRSRRRRRRKRRSRALRI